MFRCLDESCSEVTGVIKKDYIARDHLVFFDLDCISILSDAPEVHK